MKAATSGRISIEERRAVRRLPLLCWPESGGIRRGCIRLRGSIGVGARLTVDSSQNPREAGRLPLKSRRDARRAAPCARGARRRCPSAARPGFWPCRADRSQRSSGHGTHPDHLARSCSGGASVGVLARDVGRLDAVERDDPRRGDRRGDRQRSGDDRHGAARAGDARRRLERARPRTRRLACRAKGDGAGAAHAQRGSGSARSRRAGVRRWDCETRVHRGA
jgi:hypothetical protein